MWSTPQRCRPEPEPLQAYSLLLASFTQTAAGLLIIEIGGTIPGSDYDQLSVSGQASLSGTLQIALANGYAPPLGHEFTILTAETVGGTFTELRGAALPGGKRFEPVYEASRVKLRVVAGP